MTGLLSDRHPPGHPWRHTRERDEETGVVYSLTSIHLATHGDTQEIKMEIALPLSHYLSCAFNESAHQAEVVGIRGPKGELRLDCEEPRREATEIPLCMRYGAMARRAREQTHTDAVV